MSQRPDPIIDVLARIVRAVHGRDAANEAGAHHHARTKRIYIEGRSIRDERFDGDG